MLNTRRRTLALLLAACYPLAVFAVESDVADVADVAEGEKNPEKVYSGSTF